MNIKELRWTKILGKGETFVVKGAVLDRGNLHS